MIFHKVEQYVAKRNMIQKGDKLVVGVSGGADSICLLFVLMELQKKLAFEMVVVHVNHGLRGESADADEAYVRKVCKEHGITCEVYRENVDLIAKERKQSTEEAGRDVRREAFGHTMEKHGGTKIALAHHMNDSVETFFMNLARGTGIQGMGGIRPIAGVYIRPLLCLERREIEEFLREIKKLGYMIKLDTNGSFPDKLQKVVEEGLVDYVAMDIKNSPEHYGKTIGIENYDLSNIMKSVVYLKSNAVPYEFRTTVVREFHQKSDFESIAKWIAGSEKYYLQKFEDSGDLIQSGLRSYTKDIMEQAAEIVREYVPNTTLRGVE